MKAVHRVTQRRSTSSSSRVGTRENPPTRTLTGWIAGPTRGLGATGMTLLITRIMVVALGLIVGRQLPQPEPATRRLAMRWAGADLVTLAIILATDVVPSNRFPGLAPFVWVGYALLDGLVVLAARRPA